MGNSAEKVAGEDSPSLEKTQEIASLFESHNVTIYECEYSNSRYQGCYKKVFTNLSPASPIQGCIGPTGPTGCVGYTGSVGCTGPTGPSNGPSQPNQPRLIHKVYPAYKIVAYPKEDTKESRDSLIVPFLQEYDDRGVEIEIRFPRVENIRGELLEEKRQAYEELLAKNEFHSSLNRRLDQIFETLMKGEEIGMSKYLEGLDSETQVQMLRKYDSMLTQIEGFRSGKKCWCEEGDYDSYDCDCCEPDDASDYYFYCREQAPWQWYSYTQIHHYDQTTLNLCCYQGTKIYTTVLEFLKQHELKMYAKVREFLEQQEKVEASVSEAETSTPEAETSSV